MADADVTIIFLRHGETPQHAENRYVGRTDVPLTPAGLEQARVLAEWSAKASLTGLVSSPLQRAQLTAAPIGASTGLTPVVDERVIELDFGRGEMLTGAEMREAFPAERKAFEEDSFRNPLPGGESPVAGTARVRAAVEEYGTGTLGPRVLIVAHGTLVRLLLCDMFGIDPGGYRHVFPDVHNTSGAVLRKSATRGWGLIAWNPPLVPGAPTW